MIKFDQKAWLKPYFDMNTKQRQKTKNEFEKDYFKLARVVNLELVFNGLIFKRFGSTDQVMQNPIPKLGQTSIIFKKPDFLSEKLKTLTSSNCHRF